MMSTKNLLTAFIVITMFLLVFSLLRFTLTDWKPHTLSDKQFNEHYALTIKDSHGNIKASGINEIKKFIDGQTQHHISMNKTLDHQNAPDLSIMIKSKTVVDPNNQTNSATETVEKCNNHCQLSGEKTVSYQKIIANNINAGLVLFIGLILISIIYLILHKRLNNFNHLMFLSVSLILFYRLAMSFGFVAQKLSGTHYIINNLLLLLAFPTLLALWTSPASKTQIATLKKPLLVFLVLPCVYLILDFLYLNLLFAKGFYDILFPMIMNYKTAWFEFFIMFLLVLIIAIRFHPIGEKILTFIHTNKKSKYLFGGLVVILLLITTIPKLMEPNSKDGYPVEIWISFLLPILLLWIFYKYKHLFYQKCAFIGNKFVGIFILLMIIIFLAIAGLSLLVFNDMGSIIYLIFSMTAFVISLILLLIHQKEPPIQSWIKTMLIAFLVLGVLLVVAPLGLKIYTNQKLLNAWDASEKTYSTINLKYIPSLAKPNCAVIASDTKSLTADDITNIDTCFENSKTVNNINMRLYGWLIGHPLNHVLSADDMGRLQDIEQLKAYHTPKNLFWGDKYMISYSHLRNISGYEYEHIFGAVMIKPNGLLSVVILIFGWGMFYCAIPRQQIATRTLIGCLGFVSTYIGLQSLNILPFFGNNNPLMSVGSFGKDTLPMISGLTLFIIFGESLSIKELNIEQIN